MACGLTIKGLPGTRSSISSWKRLPPVAWASPLSWTAWPIPIFLWRLRQRWLSGQAGHTTTVSMGMLSFRSSKLQTSTFKLFRSMHITLSDGEVQYPPGRMGYLVADWACKRFCVSCYVMVSDSWTFLWSGYNAFHSFHSIESNKSVGFQPNKVCRDWREVQTHHSLLVVKHTARGNLCSLKGSMAFSSWFALLMYSSAVIITIALYTFRVAFGFLVPPQPPATYQTWQYSITIHMFYVMNRFSSALGSNALVYREQFFGGIFLWATLWGALSLP